MIGALSGFGVIWLVIGVGTLLGHLKLVDERGKAFLSGMSFLVASPALLFMLASDSPTDRLFSRPWLVSALAIAGVSAIYLVASRILTRPGAPEAAVGVMSASYVNAGNLGLPIAAYVMGDMAWMAPVILLQVAFIQPVCLAVLDANAVRLSGSEPKWWSYPLMPFKNPLTLGILLGMLVNVTQVELPEVVTAPIAMIGDMAIPMTLLAFGVSLRIDPKPGVGPHVKELWLVQVVKIVIHPLLAWSFGSALGLDRADLLAVTVIAALPTAQNVFIIASRYSVATQLARDAVFWSTITCVGTITFIAAVL